MMTFVWKDEGGCVQAWRVYCYVWRDLFMYMVRRLSCIKEFMEKCEDISGISMKTIYWCVCRHLWWWWRCLLCVCMMTFVDKDEDSYGEVGSVYWDGWRHDEICAEAWRDLLIGM